jgi:hypothetical protein
LKPLKLRDLQIGNIDAKNELLTGSDEEIEFFQKGFCLPPNIVLEDFLCSKKYFVTGLKGIGKTALLRFIAIEVKKRFGAKTSFILFKTEVKEQDRKSVCRASRADVVEKNIGNYPNSDFEVVWKWFLHRKIVDIITECDLNVFVNDDNYKKYKKCVTAPKIDEKSSGIKRLIPNLNKGSIELSKNPKIELNFDWEDKKKTRVKFFDIAKQADQLFMELKPSSGHLYLFLDELELSLGSQKQYKRDAALIRDLIIAVEHINSASKKLKANITVYAGIRSEVISAIESVGKEINKIIGDFGSQIVWHQTGCDNENHPLLNIIVQRISISEEKKSKYKDLKSVIWEKYFTNSIQGIKSEKYVLHNSWYRPRDMVRLLNLARDQFPDVRGFRQRVFDGTRKQYSQESWTELAEELSVKYNQSELSGIQQIFNGFQRQFSFKDLQIHIDNRKSLYPAIKALLDSHNISEILTDLYNVGFLGNIISSRKQGNNAKMRFSFRGDPNLIIEEKLTIHKGLYSYLTL